MKNIRKNLLTCISVVGFLIIWQVAAMITNESRLFPTPIEVLEKIWKIHDSLFAVHFVATMKAVIIGIFIAVGLGFLIAVIMDLSKNAEYMFYPMLIVLHMLPTMCIAPLFVLWFGYGMGTRLIVIVLSLFFSVTVNTFDGFKAVQIEMEELLKSYGASRLQIFVKVEIPSALPNFFSSLKMVIPWSLVGVAVAEWLGATEGLGYYSKQMIYKMDGAGVFAPIVVMAVVALIGMGIVNILDKKVIWWRGE